MAKSPQKVVVNHRSAVSGKFVTERFANAHKSTTVTEHNKLPQPAKPTKSR